METNSNPHIIHLYHSNNDLELDVQIKCSLFSTTKINQVKTTKTTNKIKAVPKFKPIKTKFSEDRKINKDEPIIFNRLQKQEPKSEEQNQTHKRKFVSTEIFLIWKKIKIINNLNFISTTINILILIIVFILFYPNINYSFFFNKNIKDENQRLDLLHNYSTKILESIKDLSNVPKGVFSYTNEGFFAALLREGLIQEVVKAFPDFEFKYFPPLNKNPSYSTAIESLLKGEIDFLPLGRPLTSSEYNKAKLQNITLKETVIARDGIVFYVNPELSVDKITIAQLLSIFKGEIKNWKEVGGEDLPITSVILSPENLESLGFEVRDNAKIQYASRQTLAVRKVISNRGFIGYGSASLVKDQKHLKFLTLGKVNRINSSIVDYVQPFIKEGVPNKPAFENGTYPLVRNLNIAWIDSRPSSQAAGNAISNILLSYEGQEIIDQAGFIPINKAKKSVSQLTTGL